MNMSIEFCLSTAMLIPVVLAILMSNNRQMLIPEQYALGC